MKYTYSMKKLIFITSFMLFMVSQLAQSQARILVHTGTEQAQYGTKICDCYSLLGYESTYISDDDVKLSDLSGYQLAILVFPGNSYDAQEVAQFSALLERGGRIFCITDKAENFSIENGYLNELIQALGGNSTYLNESCAYGSADMVIYPGTNFSSTIDLFQDVDILHTAVFSPISLGGNARELVRVYKKVTYGDSRIMMTQEAVGNGDIVMSGDVSINYSGAVMDDASSSICQFYTHLMTTPPYVSSQLSAVTTSLVTDVTSTSVTANASLYELGSPNPTQHGFCWSTENLPALDDASDSSVDLGSLDQTGTFSSSLSGLTPNTTYYVRAYVTNDAGTAYGEEVSFTTLKQSQTITFDELTAKTYGDVPFDLEALASSGLAVSYVSSNPAVATVSDNTLTILGAGTTIITASQAGNATYVAADDVAQTLTVQKKAITVTADANQTKVYGSHDPVFTYSVDPALEGEDAFAGALTRTAGEDVGAYAIGLGSLTAGDNYDLAFVGDDFTITAKAITVTADANQTKVYGSDDPVFTYSVDPALEGEDAFTGALTRTAGEDVGAYAIGQGSLTAGDNYDLAFVGANMTITKATPEVTAWPEASVITYGQTLSASQLTNGSAIISGAFVFDDPELNPAVGTCQALVWFVPSDGNNYTSLSETIEVSVSKGTQTITFVPLEVVEVGVADFVLGATSDAGLTITYISSNPAVATIEGNTVHVVGGGTTTITASQPGDEHYAAAQSVARELTVQVASAIEEETVDVISFYPNPAKDRIFFNEQVLKVAVYSLTGTKVLDQKVENGSLDVTSLGSGVYFIRVDNQILKLIVRK